MVERKRGKKIYQNIFFLTLNLVEKYTSFSFIIFKGYITLRKDRKIACLAEEQRREKEKKKERRRQFKKLLPLSSSEKETRSSRDEEKKKKSK